MDDVTHSSPPAERPSHSAGSDSARSCQFFSPSGETRDKIKLLNSALLRGKLKPLFVISTGRNSLVLLHHTSSILCSQGKLWCFVLYTLLDKSPWWVQETWCELPCRHRCVCVVAWHLQQTDSTQACNYCGKGVHVPSRVCKYACPFTCNRWRQLICLQLKTVQFI